MLLPKFTLEDVPIGSGSIIGKDNIEEFEDRSLAELAPNYETAATSLVHMLEARFVNLNPIIQQMFLNLHDVEDIQKLEGFYKWEVSWSKDYIVYINMYK